MKLKILTLFFVILCLSIKLHSQTLSNKVVASGGSFITASWGSLSSTIGEAIITTLPSANVTLLQGFQQPTSGLAGITLVNKTSSVNVYPNPAINTVLIEVTLPITTKVTYKVYDVNGKELMVGNFAADASHSSVQELDFSKLNNGMYLISISKNQEIIQNIKIQINH